MTIELMTEADFKTFWPVFKNIVEAQETYAFEPDITCEEGIELWLRSTIATYVAKDNEILGSYYIKKNASGPSSHISNCGYMVAPNARGKGVATKMCLHSQEKAKELGFTAMQFNSVVSTNETAINLWKKLGFKIIGTIPKAYNHGKFGLVDSYIMHKFL
jgi:ribosomal protein S18 acetylase RimI-like enzyme